jgi:hypothetical protein
VTMNKSPELWLVPDLPKDLRFYFPSVVPNRPLDALDDRQSTDASKIEQPLRVVSNAYIPWITHDVIIPKYHGELSLIRRFYAIGMGGRSTDLASANGPSPFRASIRNTGQSAGVFLSYYEPRLTINFDSLVWNSYLQLTSRGWPTGFDYSAAPESDFKYGSGHVTVGPVFSIRPEHVPIALWLTDGGRSGYLNWHALTLLSSLSDPVWRIATALLQVVTTGRTFCDQPPPANRRGDATSTLTLLSTIAPILRHGPPDMPNHRDPPGLTENREMLLAA